MRDFDGAAAGQIRDGAGHFKYLVMGPGREFQFFHGLDEDRFSFLR